MIVYRICDKEEVEQILQDNNFNHVGNYGSKYKDKDINTHDYKENEKYLHFFKNKDAICFMSTVEGRCICTYDIPEEILEESVGVGQYWEYLNFRYLVNEEEYAIKTRRLEYDFLIQVDEVINYIDAEDYLFDYSLEGFVKTIYQKEKQKVKRLPN